MDWDAEDYAQHSSLQYREARGLIRFVDARPGFHVLDVGCGDGAAANEMQRAGASVVGLDPSPSMASATFGRGITTVQARASDLPFADCSFHRYFSNAALHWEGNHRRVILEASRVLVPGGLMAVSLGASGNQDEIERTAIALAMRRPFSCDSENPIESPWTMADPKLWHRQLVQCDLEIQHFSVYRRSAMWTGPQEALVWFRTVAHPFLSYIPRRLHQEYLEAVIDEAWPNIDLETAFARLRVVAVKRPW